MQAAGTEGWADPNGFRGKTHFYETGISLCRKSMRYGQPAFPPKPNKTNVCGVDQCPKCFKLRQVKLKRPVENAPWTVEIERLAGDTITMSPKTGKLKTIDEVKPKKKYSRIRFRRANSRGRWETFVLVGEVPKDHQELVNKYIETEKRPRT